MNNKIKYEFHIAKHIRSKYKFDDELFSITGNVIFTDFKSIRKFVQKINSLRDDKTKVRAGEVNAAGLLDEIFHFLIRKYENDENPGVFNRAASYLQSSLGKENLNTLLLNFIDQFPPLDVYKKIMSGSEYLNSSSDGKPNKEIVIEEMILLFLDNFNPANKKLKELFDENYLTPKNLYSETINHLEKFFNEEKTFGPSNQPLFEFLKTPILNNPDNHWDQLEFIKTNWKELLNDLYIRKILSSHDLMKEDVTFDIWGGGGAAPTVVPEYKGIGSEYDFLAIGKSAYKYALDIQDVYEEEEKFTPDVHWMPNVILIAKNAFVWLDQLSKKYQRHIHRLDQIPDEELDQLKNWNINALWLIGVWERSSASKKIKHLMGNIDAVASAYSLYDYIIAKDLGGEEAYKNLHERAKQRGIRLASDMVPNHTGIYSKWVIEHPDYFIQVKEPPFPNYKFTREDLSEDPSVQIRIEDSYYEKTDAAVVFQRIDNLTGETTYIYHGNDGTNMPWNDTAQLNMLKEEVRQAVIDKIFDVAKRFSIIRFDAAMTLTKKHFSRLWYPEPGKGGDIPSRSDFAMSKEEFDKLFPVEFWREVVDRINEELPDTLLLAEAFWLMEGYFVRTLGMHRVYNSAFMNMMKNEENEKYRDLITNTLEFEPEILKRYVNFMSNPDEETAIHQFGTGDKYFGVATLMCTLPGLPMFAHGQIEGFTEKYGMEYKRAYYDEQPDANLISRHRKEIFPLLKKRYLFSEVANFWLYDFIDDKNNINENVFALTNKFNDEKVLVLYNNNYHSTKGRIYRSVVKLTNETDNGQKKLITKTILDALNINPRGDFYYIFDEHISGLQYIVSGKDLFTNGFYTELKGFEYKVFWNFKEVTDSTGDYKKVYEKLQGKGVRSIEEEINEINLAPVHDAFENLFNDDAIENFVHSFVLSETPETESEKSLKFLSNKFYYLLNTVKHHFNLSVDLEKYVKEFDNCLQGIGKVNPFIQNNIFLKYNTRVKDIQKAIVISKKSNYKNNSVLLLIYLTSMRLKTFIEENLTGNNPFEKIYLSVPVRKILERFGKGDWEIFKDMTLINLLIKYQTGLFNIEELYSFLGVKSSRNQIQNFWRKNKSNILNEIIQDENVKSFMDVNEYKGTVYYSKERFEDLINWIFSLTVCSYTIKRENELGHIKIKLSEKKELSSLTDVEIKLMFLISKTYYLYEYVMKMSVNSGYVLERLIELNNLRAETVKNKNKK